MQEISLIGFGMIDQTIGGNETNERKTRQSCNDKQTHATKERITLQV